jgi:hypothetical protein
MTDPTIRRLREAEQRRWERERRLALESRNQTRMCRRIAGSDE